MKKVLFSHLLFSKSIISWERFLFFLFILVGTNVNGQTSWNLIKDKNNIKVYTADNNSSAFKNIKVVGLFDGTLDKLAQIFLDVDKQKKWVYGTKQSYLLKKLDDTDLLYYVETALPLVSNRDIAIHMKLNENKTKNLLTITTVGEPNAIPVTKGKVRVPRFTGDWSARVVGKNKLNITYFLFVDPGGSLPSWIVNMFVSKGPYQTFEKLGDELRH